MDIPEQQNKRWIKLHRWESSGMPIRIRIGHSRRKLRLSGLRKKPCLNLIRRQRCGAKRPGLSRFVGGALVLAAFGQPADAVILPPAQNRFLLNWTSLGAGTHYIIETSTNGSTWTATTNTTATNANFSYSGDAARVFRLLAAKVPLQTVELGWNASVPSGGVAGYRVYYGQASGQYIDHFDVGLGTTLSINNLLAGATYYFAVTAYSASGQESAYSNEAVWKCPLKLNIQALP